MQEFLLFFITIEIIKDPYRIGIDAMEEYILNVCLGVCLNIFKIQKLEQ
jgi:hypothetical protein